MKKAQRWRGLAVSVSIAAAVTGCETRVDNVKLEKAIASDVKGWPVKSVACPSGKKMKAGEKFTCTLELQDGQQVVFNVEVTGAKDGEVSWKSASGVIPVSAFADDLKKQLDLGSLDCPKKAIVIASGKQESLTCKMTKAGSSGEVTVTMDDTGKWKATARGAGAAPEAAPDGAPSAQTEAPAKDENEGEL